VLAAVFDVISHVGHKESWAHDFYRAATFTLVAGAAVSLFTALTGFWDWLKSSEAGTQARREANAHAVTMITVSVLVLTNIGVRTLAYSDDQHTRGWIALLSIVIAVLVAIGASIGGSLVFDHGFNVENAKDSPVYHQSEKDVLPDGREV
jgi:uncharacterized membrane protein